MIQATYSPEDNKIRIYPSTRLDAETYARVKKMGFTWAPKQELFFSTWTPSREDLAMELCGEIGDEDKSLSERAEERAERFEGYSDNREREADSAHAAVKRIADNIPMGQPILIGHHSERHARKDAARIENGMRKAVKAWETAKYWESRAAGAIRNAKYKERPDVRARRIKTIEADKRKAERYVKEAESLSKALQKDGRSDEDKKTLLGYIHRSRCFPLADYPRNPPASQYEGEMGLWSAVDGGVITLAQACTLAIEGGERVIENQTRWVVHYENRLIYERAMLAADGGTEADKNKPEKGGACKCWVARGAWLYIVKVNKVSVSVLDNWGNGGPDFSRTIPFDKLTAVMSAADVQQLKNNGEMIGETPRGFWTPEKTKAVAVGE